MDKTVRGRPMPAVEAPLDEPFLPSSVDSQSSMLFDYQVSKTIDVMFNGPKKKKQLGFVMQAHGKILGNALARILNRARNLEVLKSDVKAEMRGEASEILLRSLVLMKMAGGKIPANPPGLFKNVIGLLYLSLKPEAQYALYHFRAGMLASDLPSALGAKKEFGLETLMLEVPGFVREGDAITSRVMLQEIQSSYERQVTPTRSLKALADAISNSDLYNPESKEAKMIEPLLCSLAIGLKF